MSYKALQSYSPRVRPLDYDALQQDTGCQEITTGIKWYHSLPFSQICIFTHDATSEVYNRDGKISYTIGPASPGLDMPWSTVWAVWSASSGIRVDQRASITLPSNSLGTASEYYPTTTSDKVSSAFTAGGQLAIAIQKNDSEIEIKWNDGEDDQSLTFSGFSPVLFQNRLVHTGDDGDEFDLVVYYFQPASPNKILARFESDGFEEEKIVNPKLQVSLSQLIASEADGSRHVMYARDISGRDVRLKTDNYITELDGDASSIEVSLTSGNYEEVAQLVEVAEDDSTLSVSLISGSYTDPIQEPADNIDEDDSTLAISIESGSYSIP